MNARPEFDALFKLPLVERLELVEDLWDSIAAESEAAPVAEDIVKELRERKARHDADPSRAIAWSEARPRLGEDA